MRDRPALFRFVASISLLLLAAFPPGPPPLAAQSLTGSASQRTWGEAHSMTVGDDAAGAALGQVRVTQEAGLSLNFRSESGVEVLGDFLVPIDPDLDVTPDAVIQQLSLRLSPSDLVTLIVGKQRLNWGTARVFSAIDTLEVRANPLDVRSVLTGVSGVKAVVIPTDWLSLSIVVLPAGELRWSKAAARIDLLAQDLGLDLGFGAVKYTYFDRSAPTANPVKLDRFSVMSDGAWSTGSLVLYEEVQLRRGRETGYQFPGMTGFDDLGGTDQIVIRGVGGATIQVDLGLPRPLTLLAEYLYNGDGLDAQESRAFASRYAGWLGAGAPSGAQVPGVFTGIGGFRRQYVAVSIQELAIDRYLLVSTSGILCLESLLVRLGISFEWDVSQETSITLAYEHFHAFGDASDQPSEMLFIPFRNRLTLSFSARF